MNPLEIMARGLFTNDERYSDQQFDYCSGRVKGFFRSDAQAAIQALDAAGYAIVPKEPTEAMMGAASNYMDNYIILAEDLYKIMIEAAQPH